MAGAGGSGRRGSYETRLLVLTIAVSVLVLLLLARLRFPETPPMVTATQPLERLASRATYDDLAVSIARLEESIAPILTTLRVSGSRDMEPRRLSDVLVRRPGAPEDVDHIPALRIGPAMGVAAIPSGTRVTGIVGRTDSPGGAAVIGSDPVRRLALVQLPEAPSRALRQLPLSELRTPTYVVAVEGTRAGVTLRPVFLGRSERFSSEAFPQPLLPLGGAVVTTGALIFTLQGAFLGCVVVEDGTRAIVGAPDVLDTVERLQGSVPMPVDPGIAVQPLVPALAALTGAPHGVVVAEVSAAGPAAGLLEPGDVITQVDGDLVDSPDSLLLQLGTRLTAGPVEITFARDRKLDTVVLRHRAAPVEAEPVGRAIAFQPIEGGSRVMAVSPGSSWEAAGILAGDEILRAGNVAAPTPAEIRAAIADTPDGGYLMFVIRRGERQRIAAVQIHTDRHAAAR